ncbi:Testis-specific serine/threonine-protein kinase 1 [Halotydeus destructor]|nr:Testis-specific serine/threonine-protein kinase 1 [Halotydeus destructor]
MDKASPKTLEIIKNKGFHIGIELNFGSFSRVHKGTFKGKNVAVKIIDLSKTSNDFRTKFLPRELEALKKIDHPNIIKIYDIVTEKDKFVFVFMEIAEKGDLLDIFKKANGALSEAKCKVWSRQVADALQYLHNKHSLAHRDLKCENVLINSTDKAILTDFGFARWVGTDNDGNRLLSRTYCGSAPYVSPEIIRGQPYDPIVADAWSFGVVVYVMLHNRMPFDDDMKKMVQEQTTKKFELDAKLSGEAKDLINKLLEPNTKTRLTMDQVLVHGWLKGTVSSAGAPVIAPKQEKAKEQSTSTKKTEDEKKGTNNKSKQETKSTPSTKATGSSSQAQTKPSTASPSAATSVSAPKKVSPISPVKAQPEKAVNVAAKNPTASGPTTRSNASTKSSNSSSQKK